MYNIGSGPGFRDTYFEFMQKLFRRMGIKDIRRILKPSHFTLKNFHCVWYRDSHVLNDWLDFRRGDWKDFLETLDVPFYCKLVRFIPAGILRKVFFEPLARRKHGTLNWIENNDTERIRAYWGTGEARKAISDKWDKFNHDKDPAENYIDHGFDESRPVSGLTIHDCRQAAQFRGGECLEDSIRPGDIFTPIKWKCGCGDEFTATPNLVLRGGHWCPCCDTDVDGYERRAQRSRFFAQVWEPLIEANAALKSEAV
jgi:hypothetical protein